MSDLAGLIGWTLQTFSDWIAPNGLSKRRALLFVLVMCALSAGLLYLAWRNGLPS